MTPTYSGGSDRSRRRLSSECGIARLASRPKTILQPPLGMQKCKVRPIRSFSTNSPESAGISLFSRKGMMTAGLEPVE
jgi:hypothetical protein